MSMLGRIVIVTGAASGIGRSLARGFVRDAAYVFAFDLDADGLKETAAGVDMTTVRGDVTREGDVARLVKTALDRHDRIDVLVNSAGIAEGGAFLDVPFGEWEHVIAMNLVGLARCTRAVLPVMLERGHGRIVNVASRTAEMAAPGRSAYASSKAGVLTFTKAIANEVHERGAADVLVNAVIPGAASTPVSRTPRPDLQPPDAVYPHVRFVAELPRGGPSGRVFWNGREYRIYESFNER